jgi:hypothetical protein
VSPEIAARLAAMEIRMMAETEAYAIFEREGCLAVVQRNGSGFAAPGSSGMMTSNGLAYLVWREDRPLLVAKQTELPAEPEQVARIVKFSSDLKSALGQEAKPE